MKVTNDITEIKSEPASLFIGRWMPFHPGHKKLIETVLKKGKPVVIAIRDTHISKKNPYSVTERWTKIQEELKEYGSLVKIVSIPDIDEVCYGREVGYLIRRIHLDDKIEQISGTKTREATDKRYPIIWLTGQSGSGKTTLAHALKSKIGGVVLDGDEMRQSISIHAGFSKEDREEHNLRVARLAVVLSKDNPVIISVIAPFRETRKKVDLICSPTWIYVKRNVKVSKNKPYEAPDNPTWTVDNDDLTVQSNLEKLLELPIFKDLSHV